jgi:hypothetical protein
MAKQYRDPKTKQHIPYRERKSLSGGVTFVHVVRCGVTDIGRSRYCKIHVNQHSFRT